MSPIISKTFSEVSLGIQKKRLSSEFTVLTVMILYLAIASDFPPLFLLPKCLVLKLQPQLLLESLASIEELSQRPLLDLVQVRSGYVLNVNLKDATAASGSLLGFINKCPLLLPLFYKCQESTF